MKAICGNSPLHTPTDFASSSSKLSDPKLNVSIDKHVVNEYVEELRG
jgi:hypothetical protein